MATINGFPSDAVGSVQMSPAPAGDSYTQFLYVIPFADQLQAPPAAPDAGLFVFQRSVVDGSGDILTDARVEVRRSEDNVFADIFSDRDGVTQKSNPFFVDAEGFARFYAAAGLYDIRLFNNSFERILENVLLGTRLEDIPDLTDLVTPIIQNLIAPVLDDIDAAFAAIPETIKFTVNAAGTSIDIPGTWTTSVIGSGHYRITHNRSTSNYSVKLTIWDTSSDRVINAMLVSKTSDTFDYQIRSINDTASNDTQRIDIEVTFG